jgi:hypothetical protein
MQNQLRWCSLDMVASLVQSTRPRWFLVPIRVVLVTFIVTLLSFAVSLLLGIGGVVLAAWLKGAHPTMTIAYRFVALPLAALVAAIVLISSSFMEARHYRQTKALDSIERAG